MRQVHQKVIQDLDVDDIVSYLYQENMITVEEYEELTELDETRTQKCERLLNIIQLPGSSCTFAGFIAALQYKNVYTFLAKSLQTELQEMLRRKCIDSEEQGDERKEEASRCDKLYEPVSKINVIANRKKKVAAVAYKLKRLSHEGDAVNFRKVQEAIMESFTKNKLERTKDISKRMELADMRFTALEAEASSRRVKYVKDATDVDVFTSMESIIPFTSNPRLSSMTYLARYGSAVAMRETIDDGLAYLEYAKEHSECFSPCKDTGMVYYIEVNLLSQKYEQEPTESLKSTILKTTEKGIAQFSEEDDEIRKDYQRMLMLKMVYTYLGVGLFGKRITATTITIEDRDSAKKIIDKIETSEMWDGMEKRRKMLFYVAKAEYYKQQSNTDLALVHASEAEKLAKENSWNAELKNISQLVEEIRIFRNGRVITKGTQTADEILAELFEDLDDLVVDNAQGSNVNQDERANTLKTFGVSEYAMTNGDKVESRQSAARLSHDHIQNG